MRGVVSTARAKFEQGPWRWIHGVRQDLARKVRLLRIVFGFRKQVEPRGEIGIKSRDFCHSFRALQSVSICLQGYVAVNRIRLAGGRPEQVVFEDHVYRGNAVTPGNFFTFRIFSTMISNRYFVNST